MVRWIWLSLGSRSWSPSCKLRWGTRSSGFFHGYLVDDIYWYQLIFRCLCMFIPRVVIILMELLYFCNPRKTYRSFNYNPNNPYSHPNSERKAPVRALWPWLFSHGHDASHVQRRHQLRVAWQDPLLQCNGLAGLTCLLAAKSKVHGGPVEDGGMMPRLSG